MSQDPQLNIHARATGTDQAAADLKKVGDAQDAVAKETAGAKKPTDDLAGAQKKLNASTEDFTSLLSRVNPAMGGVFDAMVKGSKIFGDMIEKEIDLNAITKKLSSTFAENAGLLKGLGAASVAAIGFMVLAKSIQFVVAESKKLKEQLAALKDKQTSKQEDLIAGQREITEISRARPERGFTAGEQEQSDKVFKEIMDRGRVEEDQVANLKQLIAALVGLMSLDDIEKLAIAGVEIDPNKSRAGRRARGELALERPSTEEAIQTQIDRQHDQEKRRSAAALAEAESTDPLQGEVNLKALVEASQSTLLASEETKKNVVEILNKVFETDLNRQFATRTDSGGVNVGTFNDLSSKEQAVFAERELEGFFGNDAEAIKLSVPIIDRLRKVRRKRGLEEPEKRRKQAEEAEADRAADPPTDQQASADPAAPGSNDGRVAVNITNYNTEQGARYIGSDAAAHKRRRRNGEKELADVRAFTTIGAEG